MPPRIYCTADLNRLPSRRNRDRRNNARAIVVCLLILVAMMVAGYIETH